MSVRWRAVLSTLDSRIPPLRRIASCRCCSTHSWMYMVAMICWRLTSTEPAVKDSIIRDGQMAFYSLDIARISIKTLHDPGWRIVSRYEWKKNRPSIYETVCLEKAMVINKNVLECHTFVSGQITVFVDISAIKDGFDFKVICSPRCARKAAYLLGSSIVVQVLIYCVCTICCWTHEDLVSCGFGNRGPCEFYSVIP